MFTIKHHCQCGRDCETKYYESINAQFYCSVSSQTINDWRNRGLLKSSGKIGVGYVYTKEQLDEGLLNNNYPRQIDHVELKEINHHA